MKKIYFIIPLIAILLSGCQSGTTSSTSLVPSSSTSEPFDYDPIDKEIKGCFNYFMDTSNFTKGSPGFGLALDRYTNKLSCSIGATGFLLASYPVFVEEGLMSKEDGFEYASLTIDTILRMQSDPTTSYAGCISHYVAKNTAKRLSKSEISTIDTAILISGAITAGEYFKGEVLTKALQAWSNLDFTKFAIVRNSKGYISMGVDTPEENRKQLSAWDYYAEQLMIYILGSGCPDQTHRINSTYYNNITKITGSYNGTSHIQSWNGSIFTYQYSQAFFNFGKYLDSKGRNYYENSVNASRTNYDYCQKLGEKYKTFDSPAWGLTACDTPLGYSGELGALPRGGGGTSSQYLAILGTIAPTGAISSMPYLPNESLAALKYYQTIDGLNDPKYGLRDAFNLDFKSARWIDPDFIGIDKGIEVLQLYNFKNKDFVSNLSMNNSYVIEGFIGNGFKTNE